MPSNQGKKRIHKSVGNAAANTVGKVSEFVLQFKDVIDLAVGTNPQAALPWAGVCIGLTFLLNPAKASSDNLAGIGYVASRMEWYCSLTDKLLSTKYIDTSKDQSYEGVLKLLEIRTLKLYKELLLFQMKSVCSYYKNQGWVFIRNLIYLDGWDGQLEGIKDAETVLKQDSEQFYTVEGQDLLRNLAQNAQTTQDTLGDFHQTLQAYITDQRQKSHDDQFDQCLKDLYVTDPQAQMSTIQGKNDSLVPEVYKWVLQTKEYQALCDWESSCQVLWLHGPAGTGKTMLNIGILSEMFARPSNITSSVVYYFCEARGEGQTRAMEVLRTLVWGLLIQQPLLFPHLKDSHKFSGAAMFNGPDAFYNLRDKFMAMLADDRLTPVCLVIDALDECEDGQPGVQDLIDIASHFLQKTTFSAKIKWILSSRPEVDLPKRLSDEVTSKLVQLDVHSRAEPLNLYIEHKLWQLKRVLHYDDATMKDLETEIRKRAQNTFLWVALVLKDLVINQVEGCFALEEIQRNPSKLSELYERMMTRIEKGRYSDLSRSILEVVYSASRPLSYLEVRVLSGLPPRASAERFVRECGSFLTVEDGKVHVLHNSAREYLADRFKERSSLIHEMMFENSLNSLSDVLKPNVYQLLPGCEISDVVVPQNDPLAPLAYSCEYWTEHFYKGRGHMSEDGHVWTFLKSHFLHWLESLSLLGKLSTAIVSTRKLRIKSKSKLGASPELVAFLEDAERFTMKNFAVMMKFPLQIYGTALLFSPSQSIIRHQFFSERHLSIQNFSTSVDRWDRCRQTIDSGDGTRALAFSPDSTCFATALKLKDDDDIFVKIWDAAIGDCIRAMQVNAGGDYVRIAFTCDSKCLAVAAKNKVCLMDVNTGRCRHTIELSDDALPCIAFSPDGNSFAVASGSTTQIWDVSTWTYRRTVEERCRRITSVTFNPTSKIVAIKSMGIIENTMQRISGRDIVKLWNYLDGSCTQVIDVGWDMIEFVFFSLDGSTLITVSWAGNIQLWDVLAGTKRNEYSTPENVLHAALSPNGEVIALTSYLQTRLLNVETGETLQRFTSHWETKVAFAPKMETLISSDERGLLQIWDISAPFTETSNAHERKVVSLCFSQNGKIVATASRDKTVKLWNTSDVSLQHTLEGHDGSVFFVVFSPDNKLLVSLARGSQNIRIWDVVTGTLRHILKCVCEQKHVMTVRTKIRDNEEQDDESHDDESCDEFELEETMPCTAAFSPGCMTFAVGTEEGRVILWDVATWKCKLALDGEMGGIQHIHFIRDGHGLVTDSLFDGTEFWDLDTRARERRLTDIAIGTWVCPSSDGKIVICPSPDEDELEVWDVATRFRKQVVKSDLGPDYITFPASFIDSEKYLKTGQGIFSFSSGVLASIPDPELSKAIPFTDEGWVWQGGTKIFKLPEDFSRSTRTFNKNKIALTTLGGDVAVVEFANST